MASASPTERTMRWLRDQGYTVAKVEQRVPHSFVTRDFLGFADLLAIRRPEPGVLAVQTTSAAHLAERVAKVRDEPRAQLWLDCGNRILVLGWALRGETGKRKRWTVKGLEILSNGTEKDVG